MDIKKRFKMWVARKTRHIKPNNYTDAISAYIFLTQKERAIEKFLHDRKVEG